MTTIKEAIHRDGIHLKANFSGHSNVFLLRIRQGLVFGSSGVVRVYVKRKIPLAQLDVNDVVPPTIVIDNQTYEIDVVALDATAVSTPTPPLVAQVRPVQMGYSFGHYLITAGTAGAVVYINGEPFILTNNHVAANQSSIQNTRADIGDAVLQPGPYDKGTFTVIDAGDCVGSLYAFIPLDETGTNTVDCALVAPLESTNVTNLYGSPINSALTGFVSTYNAGDSYQYIGRSSGYKQITISDPSADLSVGYEAFTAQFEDVVVFAPSAIPGDSGSGLMNSTKELAGLVFAGDQTNNVGVGCKITNILSAFQTKGLTLTWQPPTPPPPPPIPGPNTITIVSASQTTVNGIPTESVQLSFDWPTPLNAWLYGIMRNSSNQVIGLGSCHVIGFDSSNQPPPSLVPFTSISYGTYSLELFCTSDTGSPISSTFTTTFTYAP